LLGRHFRHGAEHLRAAAPAVVITLRVHRVAAIGLPPRRAVATPILPLRPAAVAITIRQPHPAAVDTITLRAVAVGTIPRVLPAAVGIGRPAVHLAATTIIESDSRLLDEASISIRAIMRPPPHRRPFFSILE